MIGLAGSLWLSGAFLRAAAAEAQTPAASQDRQDATTSYLPLIETHLQQLTTSGLDVYGPKQTGMWMAVIDTRTGKHPEFEHTPRRVYRKIGAPRGSSLYWDQPMIVTAYRLSQLTGKREYAAAADRYLRDFLAVCVDQHGLFQWGNHCYYDAFEDRAAPFSGGYHELRPHAPAWELFWRQDAAVCERYLRVMAGRHVYDPETGGFNRHDDAKRGHAFIESGGVLVESLAWLYAKTQDRELLDLALRIARYSFRHRGETTGLVINEPDFGRWDSKVCTTEVAVWGNSLLRAAAATGEEEFARMARDAVAAYLKFGYDEQAGKYYGQLSVIDGRSVAAPQRGYWPRMYAEIWNPDQWPTHDYPLAMAEACITLHRQTGDPVFEEGIRRWAEIIRRSPQADRASAYAEQYGRCIAFLARVARALGERRYVTLARQLADEAVVRLPENGWFQGSPDSHLYEAVDGVGYLFLALLELETGESAAGWGGEF
jgi:hypothetical protein